jgi:hypothetical protein
VLDKTKLISMIGWWYYERTEEGIWIGVMESFLEWMTLMEA